jgi:hypothetical protein
MKIIQNFFAHCGYGYSDFNMLSKANSENNILERHHVRNYKEFLCISSSLKCYNENADCEEAVVE